jgi:hypothetical protein
LSFELKNEDCRNLVLSFELKNEDCCNLVLSFELKNKDCRPRQKSMLEDIEGKLLRSQ